jgi:hypothetical protein
MTMMVGFCETLVSRLKQSRVILRFSRRRIRGLPDLKSPSIISTQAKSFFHTPTLNGEL